MAPKINMENWRRHLWIFPLIAGSTWIAMLSTLLLYWVAAGRPKLPLQSNPYIAFISDIGAFHLKPVFIAGCAMTAISFMGTVFSVHYARYDARMYDFRDIRWRKAVSALALVSGLVACAALFSLTVFDTYRHSEVHGKLLFTCFLGLGTSMVSTSVVWFDQAWKPSRFDRLRRWCVVSNAIVLFEVILGAAFTALSATYHLRTAGILEWIITFSGGFYLLCFVGYLWRAEETIPEKGDEERSPLLAESQDQ